MEIGIKDGKIKRAYFLLDKRCGEEGYFKHPSRLTAKHKKSANTKTYNRKRAAKKTVKIEE